MASRSRPQVAALLAALLAAAAPPARAVLFTFDQVATTSTPVPGGAGTFTGFSPPSTSGGEVAFRAQDALMQWGIYATAAGALDVLLNEMTAVPNAGAMTFRGFSAPSFANGGVAFSGFTTDRGGIYTADFDSVSVVTDSFDGALTAFQAPSLQGSVAFIAALRSGSQSMVHSTVGGLHVAAGPGSEVPITGSSAADPGVFTDLIKLAGDTSPDISDGITVFHGRARLKSQPGSPGVEGIFFEKDGEVGLVVQQGWGLSVSDPSAVGGNARAPAVSFEALPAADGQNHAFVAETTLSKGIYRAFGVRSGNFYNALQVAADTTSVAPGGLGLFADFGAFSLDNGRLLARLVFEASTTSGTRGLFTDLDGRLQEVIKEGDTLFGKTISSLDIGREALDGDSIAFAATFTDGTRSIVRADPVAGSFSSQYPSEPVPPVQRVDAGPIVVPRMRPGFGWFDPIVAIGYHYEIVDDQGAFEDVLIPAPLPGGDDTFSVHFADHVEPLIAGSPFDFTTSVPGGIRRFTITGIDPAERIDPQNFLAFVTGVTITGPVEGVDVRMTPIVQHVSEPEIVLLLGLVLAWGVLGRRVSARHGLAREAQGGGMRAAAASRSAQSRMPIAGSSHRCSDNGGPVRVAGTVGRRDAASERTRTYLQRVPAARTGPCSLVPP